MECDQKLTWPEEPHNKHNHAVSCQSNELLSGKCVETTKVWRTNERTNERINEAIILSSPNPLVGDNKFVLVQAIAWHWPGGRLNKKDGLTRYDNSHVKDKTSYGRLIFNMEIAIRR